MTGRHVAEPVREERERWFCSLCGQEAGMYGHMGNPKNCPPREKWTAPMIARMEAKKAGNTSWARAGETE